MSARTQLARTLNDLSDDDLEEVVEYIEFLKFRSRHQRQALPDAAQLAELYAAFADEDRQLAEEGMADYALGLVEEDTR